MALLNNLTQSLHPIYEVIIVDSSDESIAISEFNAIPQLSILYLRSISSVCIQRNKGIRAASSPWIFICDDDIEVPADYIQKIAAHTRCNPNTGAISGTVLQLENGTWKANYSLSSSKELLFKYIFNLSIWGEINCSSNNILLKKIVAVYKQKGNYISKSGWPVNTDFKGSFFSVPIYGLGASVIRTDWLLASPYDEVLDSHGIGDNYGVAVDFPAMKIDVLNDAFVYHHHEPINRLQKPLQYYRRALALDYFIQTKKRLKHVKKGWLLWSLFGNFLIFTFEKDNLMSQASFKTFWRILVKTNPYLNALKNGEKVVEPLL
jgi:glycosyltransferase involved in cell wall biosynthesis